MSFIHNKLMIFGKVGDKVGEKALDPIFSCFRHARSQFVARTEEKCQYFS